MVKSEKWRADGSEMSGGVKNSNQPKAQQAQWNVQVVRGKVTTRCLWNACKALSVGLLLLAIGTTMAVIGYYADQLSIRSETRGNSTVKVKNESRGFHLNNLSYAGPIVMGIGGFIVVAACVMTFEARDSAAKVVPARFKPNLNASISEETTKMTPRTSRTFQSLESKRATSVQTPSGGRCPGSFKLEPPGGGGDWSPKNDPVGRKAFTAAFVQFSRELMENSTTFEGSRRWRRKMGEGNLNKSPSAPDLTVTSSGSSFLDPKFSRRHCKGSPKCGSRCQRESASPLETVSSNLLLRPSYLQRQALSMDNPFDDSYETCTPPSMRLSRQQSRRSGGSRDSFEMELGYSAGVSGSQASMALDLHDCQVTLKVKDESANKRSDTARRHQLLRQKPVEDDVIPRCFMPRFLCTAMGEEGGVRTNSSTNLRTACHHSLRKTGSCSGRTHIPKMTAEFRSQSFSHNCFLNDPRKRTFHEFNPKIFYIEDHRRTNHSTENVRICCEEKLRYLMRHSPSVSPQKSPRTECRVQRLEGSECLLHRTKDPPPRKKRKGNQKIEGSLSAEEQQPNGRRKPNHGRSASFSPTRKTSAATISSHDESSSPGKQSCCSVVAATDEEKPKKFETEEPS